MKTKTKILYQYDPRAERLTCFADGKPRGGFVGKIANKKFFELLDTDVSIEITNMETDKLHNRKVQLLRSIWIKTGVDDYRDSILANYNVKSTKGLTHEQLDELIDKYNTSNKKPADEDVRKLRSEVLTQLNELGIYATNNDWSNVNHYLMNEKIAGKMLFQLNTQELKELKKKLYSVIAKNEKNKSEVQRLSRLN